MTSYNLADSYSESTRNSSHQSLRSGKRVCTRVCVGIQTLLFRSLVDSVPLFLVSLPPSFDKWYFRGGSVSLCTTLVLLRCGQSPASGWRGLQEVKLEKRPLLSFFFSSTRIPKGMLILCWLWGFTNNGSELCGILKLADQGEICR